MRTQLSVSVPTPLHSSPPNCGLGSVQDLALILLPTPHVLLQGLQSKNSDQPPSIAENYYCRNNVFFLSCMYIIQNLRQFSTRTQLSVSLLTPSHSSPPNWGKGLLQVLVRSFNPTPQVSLHCDQSENSLQSPLIAKKLNKTRRISYAIFTLSTAESGKMYPPTKNIEGRCIYQL